MADIKLEQVNSPQGDNYYDITFTNGDFTLTYGLITAFMMSVFCEVRDDSIEVPQMRGGWAGNELQPIEGYQQGSLIWTKYQTSTNDEITTECQQIIEDGLQWMIDDGIAKDINVAAILEGDNKIKISIVATRNDNTEETAFFDLWLNTINNN